MQWDDELHALVLDILKYFDEQALSDATKSRVSHGKSAVAVGPRNTRN